MIKTGIIFICIFILSLIISCESTTRNQVKSATYDSTESATTIPREYKAIKYVDSFINLNSVELKKSRALRENLEALCTKQLLPLIDKKVLYNDIPFKLVATTTNNGIAYGNFVYEDNKYFVKVQCIIKKKQLDSLVENDSYFIKFKTYKFEEGFSFENPFSKVELPTVNAYLIDFKKNSS